MINLQYIKHICLKGSCVLCFTFLYNCLSRYVYSAVVIKGGKIANFLSKLVLTGNWQLANGKSYIEVFIRGDLLTFKGISTIQIVQEELISDLPPPM